MLDAVKLRKDIFSVIFQHL